MNTAVIQKLIEKEPLLRSQFLHLAAAFGFCDIVRTLLENGANVHSWHNTAIVNASKYGHLEVVRLLIEYGADVNARNCPLFWAAGYNRLEIARLLLDHGADVQELDEDLILGLSGNGYIEMARLLVKTGFNPEEGWKNAALYAASIEGHVENVRLLLEIGIDGSQLNENIVRPVALRGYHKIIELFLQYTTVTEWDDALIEELMDNGLHNIVQLLKDHETHQMNQTTNENE